MSELSHKATRINRVPEVTPICVGCKLIKRRCYWCGYEMYLLVSDEVELCPPSPEEPCYAGTFHEDYGMFINIVGQPKKKFSWEFEDYIAD